ncbi:hypothetical protein [Flavobacterium taihuense]|uniref:Uncharacterized protein n=1 Tax=Flavobacterium taihuense TaxID=2857508 RepID=A0ABS6XZF1_9FLAO|nr:hypothetical protein [Flavobacterium taihuense]MBW4362052.1 hypothetical protein [Flavobacterium taihuense]
MKKETDLLEYFIENEKKQKKITLVAAIFFSLFAIVIISLGLYAHNQNKIIKSNEENISKLNTSLNEANKKLNLAVSKLKQDSLSLNRTAKYFKKEELEHPETSNNIPLNTNEYTLYIQYMDGYLKQSHQLKEVFSEKKYTIAKEQNMKIIFKSSVRYFYPNDKEKAIKVAEIAEQTIGMKFKVQYMNLISPKNQLEIWVGK